MVFNSKPKFSEHSRVGPAYGVNVFVDMAYFARSPCFSSRCSPYCSSVQARPFSYPPYIHNDLTLVRTVYRFIFLSWSFFATITVTSYICVVTSAILGIICRFNFGQGLAHYRTSPAFHLLVPGLTKIPISSPQYKSMTHWRAPTFQQAPFMTTNTILKTFFHFN